MAQVITITTPTQIIPNVSGTNATCNGAANGNGAAAPTGGTSPYVYSWSPGGAATSTIAALAPGTYSCSVTDHNGCVVIGNMTVNQPAAIVVTPTQTNAACGSNGTATATVSGGIPPYTYTWSPAPAGGQGTTTATGLSAGTYTCNVNDANNCTAVKNYTITAPAALAIAPTLTNATCFGGSNGSATGTVSGGTPSYTYSWSPAPGGGQGTANATGLTSGTTYTLTVHDVNNCSTTQTFSISAPPPITSSPTSTAVTCNGACNGTITANVAGGFLPYTYSWSPAGGTVANPTGLCANNYTCTASDNHGCTTIVNMAITQPPIISITPTHTNATCGNSNGTGTVTVSGGTPGYTYTWSPAPAAGQGTHVATGLSAGTYTCTVNDANNCSLPANFTITNVSGPALALSSQTNVTCQGSCNGSVTMTASGGTPAYIYSWSPSGGTAATASGLCANTYTCSVTDQNGCVSTQFAVITEPPALTTSIASQTNILCNGNSTGAAQISAAGGTSAYTYSWTGGTIGNGQGTATASVLTAGTYTCLVTDNHNCTSSQVVTLSQGTAITLNITTTGASCNASCDGTATMSVSGGAGTYAYDWSNGNTTVTATNLCAATYTAQVSDNNGCNASKTCIITQPPALSNPLTAVNSSCGSACTGQISTAASGGTLPYVYNWSSGQTTAVVSALCAATYTCTLTDNKGCTLQTQATITAPASPTITGAVTGSVSGPINSGWAYLVLYDTVKTQKLIDSVAISAGRFLFSGTIGGKFLAYAVANATTYPSAVKTYSKSADQWKNAVIVLAGCATTDTANIALIELAPTIGSGSLSGNVASGAGFVPRLAFGSPVVILGEPIPGLDVNLEQHPNGIIASTTTDINGNYHFGNVPPGTFSVYVDVPGLGMVSQYTKTVTSNQMFTNLNYVADSTHIYPDSVTVITGIVKPSLPADNLVLAPNPFKDQFFVNYTLSESSDVVIEIYNILGEQVSGMTKTHQDAGSYSFRMNAAQYNLAQGVYMFRMTMQGKTITRRIVSLK